MPAQWLRQIGGGTCWTMKRAIATTIALCSALGSSASLALAQTKRDSRLRKQMQKHQQRHKRTKPAVAAELLHFVPNIGPIIASVPGLRLHAPPSYMSAPSRYRLLTGATSATEGRLWLSRDSELSSNDGAPNSRPVAPERERSR
ncbi:hypothetical protein BH18VER1_BH18VER1_19140 [soil metagenome]